MAESKIRAEFQVDSNNRPIAISAGNKTHYKIRLFMEGVPEDAYAVTYQLDESYYDPTREVHRQVPDFQEFITSYGDYDIKAQIKRKKDVDFSAEMLSRALRQTYGTNPSEAIQTAIEKLEQH
jgi:hypothetical protein